MKKKFFALLLVLSLGINSINLYANSPEQTGVDVQTLMEFILENYVGSEIDVDMLYMETFKGMFNALDEYSEFYKPEEFDAFNESVSGTFYGIGAELRLVDQYVEIVRVFEGNPAEKAGLQALDIILEVNGQSASNQTLDQVTSQIKGPQGTTVTLTIKRNGEIFDIDIVRDKVQIHAVIVENLTKAFPEENKEILDKIEFITITDFNASVAADFESALTKALEAEKEYLILDLRNNPGGYLDQVLQMANMIIPEGPIMYTVRKNGFEMVYESQLEEAKFKEIVVLVNEYTASASEILASAIQDSGVGILVGETTYGKGVVQQPFIFGENAFKLTIEEYFSRNKTKINGVGIKPDIEVYTPNYLPDSNVRYSLGMNEEYIFFIEDALNYLGYLSTEEVDNTYNETTKKAVASFQKEEGLYPSGICDFSTQARLNEVLFYRVRENDEPLEKALLFIKEYDANL
jgi:carboxyl-terminal processing protease